MTEAHSAEVIQLAAFRPKAGASPMARRLRERRAQRVAAAPADETETCKNFRLRQERHSDWCRADAVREYWKAAENGQRHSPRSTERVAGRRSA